MPTTVPPSQLDRYPCRSEQYDGRNGRRPPNGHNLKHTGGGGGDGDGNSGHDGPGQRLIVCRFGLFLAMGADLLFFAVLIGFFSVTQVAGRLDALGHSSNAWLPVAFPQILWLNTALLLCSLLTVEIARRHMFDSIDAMEEWFGLGRPTSRRALPWLLATIALGGVFLVGQELAWHQLALRGVAFRASGGFGHAFYLLTCVYAVHLSVGMAGLVAAVVGLHAFKSVESRQILVDCAAWGWQAISALWLCLFALLAFH
jgi:cytochrome c oxidase subunit 3